VSTASERRKRRRLSDTAKARAGKGFDAPHKPVLIVVTSHSDLCGTGRKTGWWLEEVAGSCDAFTDAGYGVVVASPQGGATPVDPESLKDIPDGSAMRRFQGDPEAQRIMQSTRRLLTSTPAT